MRTVLFVNHKQKQCGVYQYGLRVFNILKKSIKNKYIYLEATGPSDVFDYNYLYKPECIIFNWHIGTMAWLNNDILAQVSNTIGIHHEGTPPEYMNFDKLIVIDREGANGIFPRPLFEDIELNYQDPKIMTVGSFGFGFQYKGFERLIDEVNKDYDEAIIKLRIPGAYFGDSSGEMAKRIGDNCRARNTKPNIQLEISHDFISDIDLLNFLAGNTINVFLYDELPGRGISSVMDYALSVKKPIAISKSDMFRHIYSPELDIKYSHLNYLRQVNYTDKFREKWSNQNLIIKFEGIIEKVCSKWKNY